jgi:hypothetical protein
MAILTKPRITGAHWYTADGQPMHEVPNAKGDGTRNATLRDARKLNLYPSVTTILRVIDKPALMTWKMQQAVLSAIRNPRTANESEDYWMKRVLAGADEETSQAADLGSRIHDALEAATAQQPWDESLREYVNPVLAWYEENGVFIGKREIVVVDQEDGFAGRVDVLFKKDGVYGVADYKTRKTTPGKPVTPYDGQSLQLAAYAKAFYGVKRLPKVRAVNIYISTTEPGRVEIYEHENIAEEYEAFKAVAHIWRHTNKYDPRTPKDGRREAA